MKTAQYIFHGASYIITGLFFVLFWMNLIMRIGFSHAIVLKSGTVHFVVLCLLFLIQWTALMLYDDFVLRVFSLICLIPALLLVKKILSPVVFSQATISLICFILACVYLFVFIFQRKKPEHLVRQKCIRAVAVFGSALFFCLLFFGQFGLPHDFEKIKVKQTISSPSQEYTAFLCQYEGGKHFDEQIVYLHDNDSMDCFLFQIVPLLARRYVAQDNENIEMYWLDDQTLVINNKEYSVDPAV